MARGHAPKREAKKPKKKNDKKTEVYSPVFTIQPVEVVGKRRKPKEEE